MACRCPADGQPARDGRTCTLQNAFLKTHSSADYARWHLGPTEGGAVDETKARYAFLYGGFRRLHRLGLVAHVRLLFDEVFANKTTAH